MLTKSDFKLASDCAKKLIYKKKNYKIKSAGNEYLEMLAQGGYIISKYSQLIYSDGITIPGDDISISKSETKIRLRNSADCVLFEATILSNEKLARIDILEKKGNVINLIEVKSKSYDSGGEENQPESRLREYIEDLAFQTLVFKEAYPEYQVHSFLLLPDKAKRTQIEGLAGWFTIHSPEMDSDQISVEFKYKDHPDKDYYIEELQRDNLLSLKNCDVEIQQMEVEIRTRIQKFLRILYQGIQVGDYTLSKDCKSCEFNLGKETHQNGYRECWEDLTDIDPHIFDLHHGGSIQKGRYYNELISNRKVSFWDLDPERFKNNAGELSSRGQRQLNQYHYTKLSQEWIGQSLKNNLDALTYPLHFIDFETYSGALPHHRGMRPYEIVAFQWSCHTVWDSSLDRITHHEFLNLDYELPNFKFAESLMDCVGSSGTPLMWSPFENTILKNIILQMDLFGYSNEDLRIWLMEITLDKVDRRPGRFVDLNQMTLNHYFHPMMLGKTSIKKVLPAVWNNNPYLHQIPAFKKYAPEKADFINPYDTLAPAINEAEKDEVVKDGTGAMRAYHELMFGTLVGDTDRKEQLKQLLLQYCELDTMAMVIIWKYWMDACNK